jgi:hypothetical protein
VGYFMVNKFEDNKIILDLEEIELLEFEEIPLKLSSFEEIELTGFEEHPLKLILIQDESLTDLKEVLSILNNIKKDKRINRAIKLMEDVILRES